MNSMMMTMMITYMITVFSCWCMFVIIISIVINNIKQRVKERVRELGEVIINLQKKTTSSLHTRAPIGEEVCNDNVIITETPKGSSI